MACVDWQDIIDGYYNVTEAYMFESIPICHGGRVWTLNGWPYLELNTITYLPINFDSAFNTAAFDLSTEKVLPFSIF